MTMVLSRVFEPPDLLIVTLAGVVTPRDQVDVDEWVRESIRTVGTVRLLVLLEWFAGWRPDGAHDAAALWVRDGEGVSRIAIVGSTKWKAHVLTAMAQPVRCVALSYFDSEPAARLWLMSEGTRSRHDVPT
jgi:hypothetical protein